VIDSVYIYEKCILIFIQFLAEQFLILKRIRQNIIMNVHSSSHKAPDILGRI